MSMEVLRFVTIHGNPVFSGGRLIGQSFNSVNEGRKCLSPSARCGDYCPLLDKHYSGWRTLLFDLDQLRHAQQMI